MARSGVPTNKPNSRVIDYGSMVRRALGRSWGARDTAYQMTNGRDFVDDAGVGGLYLGAGGSPRAMEDSSARLLEDGSFRLIE